LFFVWQVLKTGAQTVDSDDESSSSPKDQGSPTTDENAALKARAEAANLLKAASSVSVEEPLSAEDKSEVERWHSAFNATSKESLEKAEFMILVRHDTNVWFALCMWLVALLFFLLF
jgi:hypothetical protein